MKFKKKLYWIGIIAVIVIVIALYFILIMPKNSEIESQRQVLARKKGALSRLNQRKLFETDVRLKKHEENRDVMKKQRNLILAALRNKNDLNRPFEAGSEKWTDTQFKQYYTTELEKLISRLEKAKIIRTNEEGEASTALKNYSTESRDSILQNFNIQRALADAVESTGVDRLYSVRVGSNAWSGLTGEERAEKVPRASGEKPKRPDKKRPIDVYYRTIHTALIVEMPFAKVPALLEKINKTPIIFRFYGIKISKNKICQVKIPAGKTWKVDRGERIIETVPLAEKLSETWEQHATYPLVLQEYAVFGTFSETKHVVVPTSEEMLSEPPVRVVLLYEVLDFGK